MKNKRIHFDDRFYWTIFSFVISICSLILLIVCIEKLPIWGYIVLTTTFSLFLAGTLSNYKTGIKINYKRGTLQYYGMIKVKKSIINFTEIKEIEFQEIFKERKEARILPLSKRIWYHNMMYGPKFVYGNGKIYKFLIKRKDRNGRKNIK